MGRTAKDEAEPKLMDQKEISAVYGLPTRDIVAAVQKKLAGFPLPVRVIGKKRWFRRSDIARYFKDKDAEPGP